AAAARHLHQVQTDASVTIRPLIPTPAQRGETDVAAGALAGAIGGSGAMGGFWQNPTSKRPIFDRAAVGARRGNGHRLALRDLAQRLVDKIPGALQVLEPRRGLVLDAAVVDERSFAVDHVHMRGGAGAVSVPDFARGVEQHRSGRRTPIGRELVRLTVARHSPAGRAPTRSPTATPRLARSISS